MGEFFMATGRSTQLTRQIGEHLVAAKLGRLGYIATPFAGNVPDFDLLIADDKGRSIPVQVKAINGGSWQFNISKFLDVEIIDDVQYVKGEQKLTNPNLVCIFVLLSDDEKDGFFIFRLRALQKYFSKNYKGGRRSKNPQSLHCAIIPKDLEQFRDNWPLIDKALKSA
jgi:hypothetical protein